MSVTECEVTKEVLMVVVEPYPVVVPYSTWLEDAWSVVQVMIAELDVIEVTVTDVITGAGSAEVVKVKLPDVACVPAEFADRAA